MKKVNVTYVSEWQWVEDGSSQVSTSAELDLATGQVSHIESSDLNTDGLEREYIMVKGQKYDVKMTESNDYVIDMDDVKEIIFNLQS